MFFRLFCCFALSLSGFTLVIAVYHWPNRLIDELEFALYEDTTVSGPVVNCGPDAPGLNDSFGKQQIFILSFCQYTEHVQVRTGFAL